MVASTRRPFRPRKDKTVFTLQLSPEGPGNATSPVAHIVYSHHRKSIDIPVTAMVSLAPFSDANGQEFTMARPQREEESCYRDA